MDSRRARRSLQMELPPSVFDASTTGVSEVVLHFNRQPSELACLSCIYPENERERAHEENVAEALGNSRSMKYALVSSARQLPPIFVGNIASFAWKILSGAPLILYIRNSAASAN